MKTGWVKKIFLLTGALAAGIVFIVTASVDILCLLDWRNGDVSTEVVCIIMAISILMMSASLYVIIKSNHKFDEKKGYVPKLSFLGRWGMNTVFAGLICAVLTAMITVSEQGSGLLRLSNSASMMRACKIALILAAAFYVFNYHNMKSRRDQIRKVSKHNSYQKRRYVFLAEEVLSGGRLKGIVRGSLRVNDRVLILSPGQKEVVSRIRSIRVNGKKKMTASDCEAVLYVPYPDEPEHTFVPYTVITDIVPGHTSDRSINTENPRITGMLEGYASHYSEKDYMSILIYDLVHAHYLVPAKAVKDEDVMADITRAFTRSREVAFMSVSSSNDPEHPVFPVFTDWSGMNRYTNVMEDAKSVSVLMTFQQAVNMLKNGYTGLVVNPFGPVPFYLSEAFIQSVTNLEGYRDEFIYGNQEGN